MIDLKTSFNLALEKQKERDRKILLLGELLDASYHFDVFSNRSRQVFVPVAVLKEWHDSYRSHGEEGLEPDAWVQPENNIYHSALERYHQLLPYADQVTVTATDVASLAETLARSYRTAQRWLLRYRIGGLLGLTPQHNPLESAEQRKGYRKPLRDVGALSESDIDVALQRKDLLGPLAENRPVSETEVADRAAQVGKSPRWLRELRSDYLKYGLMGLAPKQRSDKGTFHAISDSIVELVRGIRLSHPDLPVRRVHEKVTSVALEQGETPPSEYQVRRIIKEIPEQVKALADRREDRFRNNHRFTYAITHEGVVYQIDHCLVDVLVKDKFRTNKTRSGEVRPWLSVVIDSRSRCVIAYTFAYDKPNRHTVASLIYRAVTASTGGVPDKIYVDNGKDLVSNHVSSVTRELGAELCICAPHQPQHRGILERFFGTLNTRLMSTLPGYVNSNVVERNPTARAELTIQQLTEQFQHFLEIYHTEEHSSLGMSPIDFWKQNCVAFPPADIRLLDILLEPYNRKVIKTGINFGGRLYWHQELGILVGSGVLIRADTRYEPPDEIEVYHNNQWICTAFATDSSRGIGVDQEEIRKAQRLQRNHIRTQIEEARAKTERVLRDSKKDEPGKNSAVSVQLSIDTPVSERSTQSSSVTALSKSNYKDRDVYDDLLDWGSEPQTDS